VEQTGSQQCENKKNIFMHDNQSREDGSRTNCIHSTIQIPSTHT